MAGASTQSPYHGKRGGHGRCAQAAHPRCRFHGHYRCQRPIGYEGALPATYAFARSFPPQHIFLQLRHAIRFHTSGPPLSSIQGRSPIRRALLLLRHPCGPLCRIAGYWPKITLRQIQFSRPSSGQPPIAIIMPTFGTMPAPWDYPLAEHFLAMFGHIFRMRIMELRRRDLRNRITHGPDPGPSYRRQGAAPFHPHSRTILLPPFPGYDEIPSVPVRWANRMELSSAKKGWMRRKRP